MTPSWPYRFVSLSEEETLRRRELLDLRGSYAQWSVVVVIVVLRLYQSWSTARIAEHAAPKSRSSWWDRPLVAGWLETRRQYLICGLWLLWLLSLSVWSSGDGKLQSR